MKFAKLFDIGDEQLLIYSVYDNEEDITVIHHVTDTAIARIDTLAEFSMENHEEMALRYLESIDDDRALVILNDMQGIFKITNN